MTATTKTAKSDKFAPSVVNEVFNKVKGHSTLAKLGASMPVSFSGNDIFTFNLDGDVAIVGEGAQKPAGSAVIAPVSMKPIKVVYQHRVSDEFLKASDEKALNMLTAFTDGFATKIAKGFDIMAMHGVNPATGEASAQIGDNNLDTVAEAEGDNVEAQITNAIATLGDYDATGYAMSKTFAAALGNYKEGNVSVFPEFRFGGKPETLNGVACDINSTVESGNVADLYVGDFANAFKWGYADNISMKVIEYGDPDGQGDLQRTNEVVLRAEAFIGWAILDKNAFVSVKKKIVKPLTFTTSLSGSTLTLSAVSPAKTSGNVYKYKIADADTEVAYDQNVQTWTAWDGTSTISGVTAGKHITLVEATSDYKVRKAGSVTISA